MVELVKDAQRGLFSAFLQGELTAVCVDLEGCVHADHPAPLALIPGAFNPLHEAHRGLAETGRRLVGGPSVFELSVVNVDKPSLGEPEVRRRLAQFRGQAPVWLTRAPTFADKAALFPGVVFVVGADTAARIVALRYYGGREAALADALENIRRRGCRFLVAGRVDEGGGFQRLEDLAVPAGYRDLFAAIPEDVFRLDISSTQLRRQREA
jgi:hypothetical protein